MVNILTSFREQPNIEKAGMLIGLLLVENNIPLLPNVGSAYYALMFVALLYVLPKERISVVSLPMLGLYAVCLLSVWVNDVADIFQPYPRFISFCMITLLVSPAISNESFTRFRLRVFTTIVKLLQYVILASVIYAMMGGGYGKRNSYFQGITNQSMMLGPFAALCLFYCVYRLILYAKERRKMWIYGILTLCSLFCLLQAGSRTAFVGALFSVVVFLTIYFRNELGRYMKVVVAVCVVLALSFPVWGRYMDKLEEKNGGQTELNTNSREIHWKHRWGEFRSSPLWGIGFSSVSTDPSAVSIIGAGGQVETGSSWLTVLSMTGILGLCAFLSVFVMAFVKIWKLWYEIPLLSGFLMAILCFWTLHMLAEGYIFAGGSSLGFCVWLVLGVIYGISGNKDLAYELYEKLAE